MILLNVCENALFIIFGCVDFDVTHCCRELVQYAIYILVPIYPAKRFGQLDRFIDNYFIRNFDVILELECPD